MIDETQQRIERDIAFARYLSWAELHRELFQEEVARDVSPDDAESTNDHEWKWFGLMSYWYASLYVVVEGWDELRFVDPIVDQLLNHETSFRTLLRRYRNVVFHYQSSVLDTRFVDLLAKGAAHVYWVEVLHCEIMRFFSEYLAGLVVTDEQRVELRDAVEAMVSWYPWCQPPAVESLSRTLELGKELLAQYPDDGSDLRKDLERCLEDAHATLREGHQNWAALRSKMLRSAGVE